MLTAKWCYDDDGVSRERVFETPTVDVAYPNPCQDGPKERRGPMLGVYSVPLGGLVVIGNSADGAESMAFAFGTVYVMNDHGRTVATYRLPPNPVWENTRSDGQVSPAHSAKAA
jgi:hypothetical protein